MTPDHNGIKILWADDEIDMLKPHIRFLEGKGYRVDTATGGDAAIALFQKEHYDLVLLDEMMPGKDGLATLAEMKELDASVPIVLITKSEEETLMEDAIGRQINDYLVKPVHPSQVLLTVKRLTEAARIQEGQFTRDYVAEFNRLQAMRHESLDKDDWVDMYQKLSRLEVDLYKIEDFGLRQAHADMKRELNRDFSKFLEAEYPRWVSDPVSRPPMSVDMLPQLVFPHLKAGEHVFLVVLDCMRFDQWLTMQPQVDPYFRAEVNLFYSVLPTATPYSRNSMFSGLLPKDMQAQFPDWWSELNPEDRSKNRHEREFLEAFLKREGLGDRSFKYQRVFHPDEEAAVKREIHTYSNLDLVALVFNFLDLLTHGRSESRVLRELAPDEAGFRSLLASWFSHSALLEILKGIAGMGGTVVLTTDHGAIQARRSTLVHGDRQTSTNLRYKFGTNLRSEDKETILIKDPEVWGLPNDLLNKNYILAREDYYCVYPTNFHEYERLYRNSFQHGGVAMEEVILPCVVLRPR